jgi:hypothetical protein
MRVLCTSNRGLALSAKYLALGNTPRSEFHVQIGQEYVVFAVAIYSGVTMLLLEDDDHLPNWYPLDLFTISQARIPSDWFSIAYPGTENGLQFLVGYERLVSDESHYDALLEREPEALGFFLHTVAGYQSANERSGQVARS